MFIERAHLPWMLTKCLGNHFLEITGAVPNSSTLLTLTPSSSVRQGGSVSKLHPKSSTFPATTLSSLLSSFAWTMEFQFLSLFSLLDPYIPFSMQCTFKTCQSLPFELRIEFDLLTMTYPSCMTYPCPPIFYENSHIPHHMLWPHLPCVLHSLEIIEGYQALVT